MRKAALLVLAVSVLLQGAVARAIDLEFQSGNNANVFWIVDQISQWDARFTSPTYRDYWQKKLGFDDRDFVVMEQYARMRRRLAEFDKEDVRGEISPWLSLFGSAQTLPHERFALAFLETQTVNEAAALLKLSPEDTKILVDAFIHFAKKVKDHYGAETAHLKSFIQKARILISLADSAGFIEQMKTFYGVQAALPKSIPVNVLWAPPGFVKPAHLEYHIILPVSVDKAETDEAVLQHLSMAIQEVGQYLLTRLPPETLRKASARVLAECGYANASRPGMLAEAIQVAMGEVLFLRERFPDLPPRKLLVPWDPDLEFPYAADELARALGIALKEHFGQPGGFASGFLDRTIQILKSLFPPRPRFFAYTALLFGDRESRELFAGLFRDWDRKEFDINDYGRFVSEWEKAPNRPVFMAVTVQNEGNVLKALKRLAEWNQISNALRSAKTGPFVYSVPSKNAGQVFIVRTADLDSMRKALVRLFSMSEVATGSISIK